MKKSSQGIERRTRGRGTIYGGKGDSRYYLSNGNNWLDAGGSGEHKIIGAVLFARIQCEAANDLEWRMVA